MIRIKVVFVLLVFVLAPSLVLAESITLTTYYPSPYGSYDRLKLGPRTNLDDADCDETAEEGVFYYSSDDNGLKICIDLDQDGTPKWEEFQGVWNKVGDNLTLDDADFTNLRVGIGDATPDAFLEISGSGGNEDILIVSDDDDGDGDIFSVKGTGNVGVGTSDPAGIAASFLNMEDAKFVIKGETSLRNRAGIFIVDVSDNPTFFVADDGKTGINILPSDIEDGHTLEVGGAVEIQTTGIDSMMTFNITDSPPPFTIGVDEADGNFKINAGNSPGGGVGSKPLIVTSDGDVIITGSLTVIDEWGNEGDVQVQWVDDGVNPGYYATYAP